MDVSLRVHARSNKIWVQEGVKAKEKVIKTNFISIDNQQCEANRYLYISHNWLVNVMSKLLHFDFPIVVFAKHFVKLIPQVHEIKHIGDNSKVILKIDILAF